MNFPGFLDLVLSEGGASSPLRSILFDSVTGVPTLALMLESIREVAAEQKNVGLIFIDTTRMEKLEEERGWEVVDKMLQGIRVFLDSNASRFAPLKFFTIHRLPGDHFLVVLYSGDVDKALEERHVAQVSSHLEGRLNEYLMSRVAPEISQMARIFTGYSLLQYNSNVRFERSIARAINKAYQSAVAQQEKVQENHVRQLEEIVRNNQIRILFQPILDLQNPNEVIGHEALSRGPEGSLFEAAEFMFSLAGNCGMLETLENLCQTRLISTIEEQGISQLIFVNLEPSFLEEDGFMKLALFSSDRIRPENVVLEITERVAIRDYDLVSRALETIRKRGFRIAVDDVGSGYASLQSIAYLKPDFIKISDKMVQGISNDFIKQEIVKTLRDLASRFSASLIAEGIEQEKELNTLRELQVPYGQGFLFHRPADRLLP